MKKKKSNGIIMFIKCMDNFENHHHQLWFQIYIYFRKIYISRTIIEKKEIIFQYIIFLQYCSISYIFPYEYSLTIEISESEEIIVLYNSARWNRMGTQFRIKQWMRELLIYRRSLLTTMSKRLVPLVIEWNCQRRPTREQR